MSYPPRVLHNESKFAIDNWKGPLVRARPRPLKAWVTEHMPRRTVELARRSTWDGEWSQGIFLAAGRAVLKHPPQAYVRLAKTLTGVKPECCHYLERTWRYLFGEM
mmetsp:Transcript_19942/g.45391  ORF Transcript_19942/g.45391 Transcript_19942/m.45391 type:complete len:106 (-) Transcript_19942:80-397(-)